jgi:adenylate cyclase
VWRRKSVLAGAVAVLVLIIGAGIWNFHFRKPKIEPASEEKMAFPLPDKPSIAVLPFMNMSGDPGQEFLSDGITESIITGLSQLNALFVIARNSTFTYKGKPVKVQQVAEDLGVRYVLEGSVQRSGERLRITAQFIDALKGHHLWSERYDRELTDLFAIEDEITKKIITSLQVILTQGEQVRIYARGTENLDAYLKYMEGREHNFRFNKDANFLARQRFEEAIALAPGYSSAHALLGKTYIQAVFFGWSPSPKEALGRAFESANKALSLDEFNFQAHGVLAYLHLLKREHDTAVEECERAVSLAPNAADSLYNLGVILRFAGRVKEAIPMFERAIRLNPIPPASYLYQLALSYAFLGDYEKAIRLCKEGLSKNPDDLVGRVTLIIAYGSLGREDEARSQVSELLRFDPKFSLEQAAKTWPYKKETDRAFVLAGLRKAGLPEKPPLPLPDKPSIAVLPFVNMSDDKSQEYFSDGLTEEIINALVKLPQVFVIARNSSFTYKGKSVDVRLVGREMGVKYVLEGSVRREGERIRVTAQLVDATTGNHLFSERYDREVKDLFALQDDITLKVMTAMRVQLTEGEYARASAKGTKNLEAYLKAMQSYQQRQVLTKEGQARARQLAEEAIALDPGYAMAYCHLAAALGNEVTMGVYKNVPEILARSMELAHKAVALDNSLAQAHITLGFQYTLKKDFDQAIAEGERAVAQEPNSAEIVASLAAMLEWADRPEEAMPLFKKAMRLSPIPQTMWLLNMASAHVRMGQYEESIPICKAVLQKQPDQEFAHIFLAIAYISTGREQEARAETAEILRVNPQFSWERLVSR